MVWYYIRHINNKTNTSLMSMPPILGILDVIYSLKVNQNVNETILVYGLWSIASSLYTPKPIPSRPMPQHNNCKCWKYHPITNFPQKNVDYIVATITDSIFVINFISCRYILDKQIWKIWQLVFGCIDFPIWWDESRRDNITKWNFLLPDRYVGSLRGSF